MPLKNKTSFLDKIKLLKQREIEDMKPVLSHSVPSSRLSFDALVQKEFVYIFEIKLSSPSEGEIIKKEQIKKLISIYENNGADIISFVGDKHYFAGSFDLLSEIRGQTHLPILYKDFIIDKVQIEYAVANGADLVLLISELLTKEQLHDLAQYIISLGRIPLIELHSKEEISKLPDFMGFLVGVNCRDLSTLKVDAGTHLELISELSKKFVIAESGIHSSGRIEKLKAAGYRGVLIGTSILKSGEAEKKVKELRYG